MALTWKILLFANFLFYIPVAIKFYRRKYFYFFLYLTFIEPLYIVFYIFLSPVIYEYIPIAVAGSLLFLPANDKKGVIAAIITALFLLPYFETAVIFPPLISIIAASYIIFSFTEQIIQGYKLTSSVSLFIPLVLIDFLKESAKIYFYFMNPEILWGYYLFFLAPGAAIPLIIAFLGPDKKFTIVLTGKKSEDIDDAHLVNSENLIIDSNKKNNPFGELSKAEMRVLELLAEGYKSNEISEKLFISRRTVYLHTQNIRNKLNIHSSFRLVKFAIENHEFIPKIK